MTEATLKRVLLMCVSLMVGSSPLAAQGPESIDVPATLRCFEESVLAGNSVTVCPEGVVLVGEVQFQTSRFDSTSVAAVADGLRDMALFADSSAVRVTATRSLAHFGWPLGQRLEPVPGTVDRLANLYDRTTQQSVRETIVSNMYRQGETEAATAFLMRLASSEALVESHRLSIQYMAIQALGQLDPDSGAALRKLFVDGSVSDRQARAFLERLADADFRSTRVERVEGYGKARVTGLIRDFFSGEPLRQAYFCAGTPAFMDTNRKTPSCSPTDNQGRFIVDSLPAGRYTARWACHGRQWVGYGRWLGVDTLVYEDGKTTELNLLVDGEGCDRRPRSSKVGRFDGYYSYGFEHSRFHLEGMPGAWIWVELSSVDWSRWPDELVETDVGYPCVYVEWIGELRGPGYYGHMGVSDHQFTVDSIITVRPAESFQCDH